MVLFTHRHAKQLYSSLVLKFEPKIHDFTIFPPLRYQGQIVGDCRQWYLKHLEEGK